MRYARRVDGNHSDIVTTLRAIGVQVHDMSRVGAGFPDLCCMVRGNTVWLEVKNGDRPPSARKLTVEQVRFHESARLAGVVIHVVESVDQALAVFGARVALTKPEQFAERAA